MSDQVYIITISQRGEEEAGVLSAHRTLEGAKAAIRAFAEEHYDDPDATIAEYGFDDGLSFADEETWLSIQTEVLED